MITMNGNKFQESLLTNLKSKWIISITSLSVFNNYGGMTAGDYLQSGTESGNSRGFFVNIGRQKITQVVREDKRTHVSNQLSKSLERKCELTNVRCGD